MKSIVYPRLFFLGLASASWILGSVRRTLLKTSGPMHILFCTCDHYEPGTQNVPLEVEKQRVQALLERYPVLAKRHKDAAGNVPKRTWFFPPHYHRNGNLQKLVSLCEQGFGEVELHLHHGNTPDTAENLRRILERSVEEYSRLGIFGSEIGNKRYGFIHGNWALNNSRSGRFCGVNTEISILKETGCYADFTFPSPTESNPLMINSVFYAVGHDRPKSYSRGIPVRRGRKHDGGLMLIQGPLYPFLMDSDKERRSILRLRALGDSISTTSVISEKRVDAWARTGIHVLGKPDWIIIKTSMHGAVDADAALGDQMERIFSYLESKYNDSSHYVLHYVTARELYNIVKAIEAGEPSSDPEEYRDFLVRPPIYNSAADCLEASEELRGLLAKTYR